MKHLAVIAILLFVFQHRLVAQVNCTIAGKTVGNLTIEELSGINGFELTENFTLLDGSLKVVKGEDTLQFHLSASSFSKELKSTLSSLSVDDKFYSELLIVTNGSMAHKLEPIEFVISD